MTAFSQPIHVFVVAPLVLCWGFDRLVNTSCPGIRISGNARSLEEALVVARRTPVDVLVVDHDEGYGREVLIQAAATFSVLLLTSGEAQGTLEQLRATGVANAVCKREDPSMLVHAIRTVWEMKFRCGQRSQRSPTHALAPLVVDPEQARIGSLTAREQQLILVLMCNPCASGKVLADRLCISEHTLRNHLTSVYAKLGVQSRLSLHAYAARHQLQHRLTAAYGGRSRSEVPACDLPAFANGRHDFATHRRVTAPAGQ